MDQLSTAPTCGSCRYGRLVKEDLKQVECGGVPPIPAVMGMGQAGPVIAVLRPRLPRTEPGCALHKPAVALQYPAGAA